MPVGFGAGHQYKGGSKRGGDGDRQDLESGSYPIEHRFVTKDWNDGKGAVLNLQLRRNDEDGNRNQVTWLSMGPAQYVQDDGKVARQALPSTDGNTEAPEGPMLCGFGALSAKTKGAVYLASFQEEAGIADDAMTDLRNLDGYVVTIKMVPNPDSAKGRKQPMLVGVAAAAEPPKPKPAAKKTAKSGPAAGSPNGLSDDQQKARAVLVDFLGKEEILLLEPRGEALKALRACAPGDAPQALLLATTALSGAVLAAGGSDYRHDEDAHAVVRL